MTTPTTSKSKFQAMNERADSVIALRRQVMIGQARQGSVLAFTKFTKRDYEVNWHHSVTAKYLRAFILKRIRRLIILEPPRYGKSELSSRRLPALLHGLFPNDEILAGSYNGDLASDMTIDVQRIMDSEAYQEIFPLSKITPPNAKSNYARSSVEHELIPLEDNPKFWRPEGLEFDKSRGFLIPRGSYRSAGVGGSFTGRGGNWILVDDPIKNREDADSPAFRDTLYDWYRSTVRTRLEKNGSILITLTHWHEDDLVGRLLKLQKYEPEADRFHVLRLPAIKESDDDWFAKYGLKPSPDPRQIGEPLWPEKFPVEELKATKASSGSRDWSALYQQRPTSEGGNLVQRDWFKTYKAGQLNLKEMNAVIISCDMATKDKQNSDFYVYQVWGRKMADRYLIYQLRGRWNFPMALDKFRELCKMFPQAGRKYIESKANGPAIAQTLKRNITGIVEREPDGDKVARFNAVTPEIESGNVWVPDPEQNPWVNDYLDELCDFPNSAHDDQVDATSQALIELRKAGPIYAPIAGHGSGAIYT